VSLRLCGKPLPPTGLEAQHRSDRNRRMSRASRHPGAVRGAPGARNPCCIVVRTAGTTGKEAGNRLGGTSGPEETDRPGDGRTEGRTLDGGDAIKSLLGVSSEMGHMYAGPYARGVETQ